MYLKNSLEIEKAKINLCKEKGQTYNQMRDFNISLQDTDWLHNF